MKQDNVSRIIGTIAKRLIESSKKSRKRFLETGREIMRYGYSPDYGFEYQKRAPKAFFQAKVALTAEAFQVLGPYLFPQVPVRQVNVRRTATPEGIRRAEIMQDYLNYTPGETGLRDSARRGIIEAIGYGRGVHIIGADPRTGLMCSMWETVKNLGTDPDARTKNERNFYWRRRVRPRFEVIREYPEARQVIMEEPIYEMRRTDLDSSFDWEQSDSAAECICYYELYMRVGIHNFKGGTELVKALGEATGQAVDHKDPAASIQIDDSPLKYCVTESGKLMDVGEWDIPFFEDGLFPMNELDVLDNPDSDYPESPLASALGYQRAINWITTLLMGKFRYTSKTLGAVARGTVGEQVKQALLKVGSDIDILDVPIGAGDTKGLSQIVNQWDWNHDYLTHGINFLNLMQERYQKASGVYDVLYAGDTGRQMRSAQEAQMKERNSRSRIDDMKDRVTEWLSRGARMEALGARYLHDRKFITAILGPEAGNDWGFLVRPEAMDVQNWAQGYVDAGVPPDQAMEMAQQQMAQAVSLEQWRNEVDFTIEASSLRRNDIDSQIDALREMMNQTVPTLLQSPNPMERAQAFDVMATFYEKLGIDRLLIDSYKAMAQQLRATPMAPPPEAMLETQAVQEAQ